MKDMADFNKIQKNQKMELTIARRMSSSGIIKADFVRNFR